MDNSLDSGCKKQAVAAIYEWMNKWANTSVNVGDPIPYKRDGKSYTAEKRQRSTILGEGLPKEVARIIEVSVKLSNKEKIENKSKLEDAQKCMEKLKEVLIALPDNRLLEPVPTTREHWNESEIEIPANVICSMGVYKSLLISNYLAASQIDRLISEIETGRMQKGRNPKDPRVNFVAEEMVRLYAKVTGEAPPNSHRKDGYHGAFSPAVDEVRKILGLEEVNLQRPIIKAISKLSPQDFKPPSRMGANNYFSGTLLKQIDCGK